jgi:CrcB protein
MQFRSSAEASMSLERSPPSLRPTIARTFLPGAAALSAAIGLAAYFAEVMGVYFAIAIGSALGGVARFWCSGIAARLIGETFPWGTLIINVIGSLVVGFFAALTGPDGRVFVGSTARQFVMIGICGGYTTFSSFSLQTLNLMNDGEWLQAGVNIGASVVLCLVAVWAGHVLAIGLNTMKLA